MMKKTRNNMIRPPRRPSSNNYNNNDVPKWEKRFCLVVGRMEWKDFLEAKKYTGCHSKVLDWDDLACKESFQSAKNRFWSMNGGPPFKGSLPNPDMYIDQVDWEAQVDPGLEKDLEMAGVGSDDDGGGSRQEDLVIRSLNGRLEDIIPTGWNVHDEPEFDWRDGTLTGLIVGDA